MTRPLDIVESDPAQLARAAVAIVPVVVCEKGEIAGEQSSRNWGWCRKMGRDPAEVPLAIESLRLWAEMDAAIGAETGFRRCGIVYLSRTPQELARREAWLEQVARPHGLDSRLLTRDQMARALPGLAGDWAGGLFTPSDGRAEPGLAAPAIARAARAAGAAILTGCAVRGVDIQAGRVAGVVTEKGRIACDSVLVAGGVWSSMFLRPLGIRLPQLRVTSAVMRTEPVADAPEASVGGRGFSFRKRLDGGYTVANWSDNIHDLGADTFRFAFDFWPALRHQRGSVKLRLGGGPRMPKTWALDEESPFERVRVLDPPVHRPILETARRNLVAAFPAFHNMKIAGSWGGTIDATPDALPVISHIDSLPGLFVATGFTGHGFGIGPGAGRLAAELIANETPVVDPRLFRYSRFIDGSRLRPHPLA